MRGDGEECERGRGGMRRDGGGGQGRGSVRRDGPQGGV